jgi:hypothetical protein
MPSKNIIINDLEGNWKFNLIIGPMEDRDSLEDERENILDWRSTLIMEGSPIDKVSCFEIT